MSAKSISRAKFYVYILSKPSGEPFYVGKGCGRRVFSHEREAKLNTRMSHKLNVIRKIWQDGGKVLTTFDSFHFSSESASNREIELITTIGRLDIGTGPLTNKTTGGDGVLPLAPNAERDRSKKSAETRRRPDVRQHNAKQQREWHKNNPAASKESVGRVIEGRRKWQEKFPLLAAAARSNLAKALGSPETRKKLSASRRRYQQEHPEAEAIRIDKLRKALSDPVVAEKARKSRRAAMHTPEYIAKTNAARARWRQENPAAEAARIEKLRLYSKSDENRKRVSEQSKKLHADPVLKQRHRKQMKALWADPEYKARVGAKIRAACARKAAIRNHTHETRTTLHPQRDGKA